MDDCLFCKIAAGEIPARKIYEDDQVVAFLDIQPVSRGHLLVIPKEHSESVVEMPIEQLPHVFGAVQRLGRAVERALGAQGFNIVVNKGAAAGQVIFHTHVHVIPRSDGDGLKAWPKLEVTDEQLDQFATDISEALQ
jgi:histidine triad (HIT) family protein